MNYTIVDALPEACREMNGAGEKFRDETVPPIRLGQAGECNDCCSSNTDCNSAKKPKL